MDHKFEICLNYFTNTNGDRLKAYECMRCGTQFTNYHSDSSDPNKAFLVWLEYMALDRKDADCNHIIIKAVIET